MKVLENDARPFDEGMEAFTNGTPLSECGYRPYSLGEDEWIRGWQYAKKNTLSESEVCDEVYTDDDEFYTNYHWMPLNEEKYGYHDGSRVKLDNPRYSDKDDDKRFVVYVDSGQKTSDGKVKAKKITFGSKKGSDLRVRKDDKDARKSFAARHNCKSANDKKTAKYWSCRAPLSSGEGKYW